MGELFKKICFLYLQLKPIFDKVEGKNKLLRSVAGGGVEALQQTQAQWDKFELMLDSHQLMIKEQVRLNLLLPFIHLAHLFLIFKVEVLKQNVSSRVKAFQQEVDRFAARWHQLKPKSDTLDADREKVVKAIEFLKEKRLEFNELDETRLKIE